MAEPITALLQQFARGDKTALDQLMPIVYAELQRLAGGYLRGERQEHTLQPTALVHEAYVRLLKQEQPDYQNRAHFMAVAARVMRQILIDHARTRNAQKRGGREVTVSLDDAGEIVIGRSAVLIAIDDALHVLQEHDPLKATLVEMRFFGGLTAEEAAEALRMPVTQVRSQLRIAQAWLQREVDRVAS
jgi:RNA polymerase sigma factor (TIGR02999 family)